MVDQLPAFVVLTPLFAALLVTLVGQWRASLACPIAILGLGGTVAAAVYLLMVLQGGKEPIEYVMGGWTEAGFPIGIHLLVDRLNSIVLVVVAVVAFLAGLYSIGRVAEETPGKVPQFYALFLLLTTGLLGMTITADAFNVYVLLEVSSLTSYALIAMGSAKRASISSFNYIIMGTIGASFYLLGVGYLFAATGTLNMQDIHAIIVDMPQESKTVRVAFILITLGLWIKMAFFPLHGWLANAYTFAPSSSSAILAPLVTKVSIYVSIRMILTVFGPEYAFGAVNWDNTIVWLAVIAIIAGSVLALAQTELKRMFCYLIVAEVGYMVGGMWLNSDIGMTGTIYHIVSDALMTLCLFIAAGLLLRKTKSHQISSLDGIIKKMPLTFAGLIAGAFAMIGIPPTCGFFSKWYLIQGGIESGHWEYVIALLVSSLINAVLFFRIIEVAYFGKKPAEGHGHHDAHGAKRVKWDESPPIALVALWSTAILLVLLGVFNSKVVTIINQALESVPFTGAAN